jgi:membrane-associated phospholipid phosphatase
MLIGFSRLYVGAHYLSDVVFAALLGVLCALVIVRWLFGPIANLKSEI